MRIIGIDPGGSGGMAFFMPEVYAPIVHKFDGMTEQDIATELEEFNLGRGDANVHCYLEKVGANRGPAGRAQGATSMFTFGQSYGLLRGILVALHVSFEEVTPQRWQSLFSLKRTDKEESITDKKNRHKAKAQQLFPTIKVTHAIADALLIAEYGRRECSIPKPF